MKKISLAIIMILTLSVGVMSVSAYTMSSYYLTSTGQYDEGSPETTSYKYPFVSLTNGTTGADAEIAVTISKKGFFGYTFISRQQKWMRNVPSYNFKFPAASTATYRANVVFNASNDNRPISGQYYLTSVEV